MKFLGYTIATIAVIGNVISAAPTDAISVVRVTLIQTSSLGTFQ